MSRIQDGKVSESKLDRVLLERPAHRNFWQRHADAGRSLFKILPRQAGNENSLL